MHLNYVNSQTIKVFLHRLRSLAQFKLALQLMVEFVHYISDTLINELYLGGSICLKNIFRLFFIEILQCQDMRQRQIGFFTVLSAFSSYVCDLLITRCCVEAK